MNAPARPHRGTLHVEDARILAHEVYPGAQRVLRLQAPRIARLARPGSFVHLTTAPELPLRRPLSLMRASEKDGWIEILYKIVGQGTSRLAERRVGESLSVLGPIGRPFEPLPDKPRPLLIGGGVGMPPMVFLADRLGRERDRWRPLAILGSEVPFPFRVTPSRLAVQGLDAAASGAMPLLEDWGVPSRLASRAGLEGAHDGYVTDLARRWLDALTDAQRAEVAVYACGPHPMLEAVARLAHDYRLHCQVSLEEFMACGVGGCAGCTVEVQTPTGPAMKRVCVDGPVFEAGSIFPAAAGHG